MKILVTGAGGFIGSTLTKALAEATIDGQRAEIFHLRRPGTERRPHVNDCSPVPIVLPGLSRIDFASTLSAHCFDYVIHLASYGVARSDCSIDEMVGGNVTFLVNLLVALGAQPRLIVNVGSCAEYGHIAFGERITEDAPLNPLSMYGGAKAAAEMIATALAHENSQRFTTLRLFGVYGEGEGPQRLLPFLVRRMRLREPANLTSGTQIRDWLHVRDVASGLIALLNAEAKGADIQVAYNLCSGLGVSVREFVDEIRLAMGVDDDVLRWGVLKHSDEPTWMVGDPSRFWHTTGWSPRLTLRRGVAVSVSHYLGIPE